MKKSIIILFAVIFLAGCSNNETDLIASSCDFIGFKYYNNTQDPLGEMSDEYVLIGIDRIYSNSEIQDFISATNIFDQDYTYTIHANASLKFKEIPLKLNTPEDCDALTQIISEINQNPIISYTHFTMKTDYCYDQIWEPISDVCINSYGSDFNAKVFNENDLSDLYQMIAQTNTEFVAQNQFMPKWFQLRATKESHGDGLAMANFFYESELFEHSEPGISKYLVE